MKNSVQKHYLLLAAFLLIIFPAAIYSSAQTPKSGTMKIKLYFPKEDVYTDELVPVERTIKKTKRVADAAVRELLKGVNENERKMGLISVYAVSDIVTGRGECTDDKMKPLAAYFLGVSIKRGKAIVNFKPEAECYLQSAATQMSRVMDPIDATLKQFSSIKEVQYALNGKIIEEWDA